VYMCLFNRLFRIILIVTGDSMSVRTIYNTKYPIGSTNLILSYMYNNIWGCILDIQMDMENWYNIPTHQTRLPTVKSISSCEITYQIGTYCKVVLSDEE
jgi:hypothetical protein